MTAGAIDDFQEYSDGDLVYEPFSPNNTQPSARYAQLRQRARSGGIPIEITRGQYLDLLAKFTACHYCNGKLNPTAGGLDRYDNTKGYTLKNVVACCWGCNTKKSTKTPEQWESYLQFKRERRELIKDRALALGFASAA